MSLILDGTPVNVPLPLPELLVEPSPDGVLLAPGLRGANGVNGGPIPAGGDPGEYASPNGAGGYDWVAQPVAKGELILNLGDYGPLGATDDAATVEACIADVNSLGDRSNGTGYVGITVLVPGRVNLPNGTTTPIGVDGVFFVGWGPGQAVISVSDNTALKWGDGTSGAFCKGGGLRGIKFVASTVTADQICVAVDFAAEISLHDIKLAKIGQLVRAGETLARACYGITVHQVKGEVANSGRATIDLRYGNGARIGNVDLYVTGVGYPQTTTETHATVGAGAFANGSGRGVVSGTNFVNLVNGSWDTLFLSNILTNRFDRGMYVVVAPGLIVNNVFLSNVVFDYCALNAIYLLTSTGSVVKVICTGGYFVATDGHGVHANATGGLMEGLSFTGTRSVYCGKNNFRFEGVAKQVSLVGCIAQGSNRLAASNAGSEQDGAVMLGSDWEIVGGSYGIDGAPNTGFANQARYGLTVQASSDRYRLIGTVLTGATGAQQNLQAHTSGGSNGLARRVSGVTTHTGIRVNNTSSTAYTIAASGVAMQNYTGMTARYVVTGGTVTAISLNSDTVGFTTGVVSVAPGDIWSITYSVAPTVKQQLTT